MSGKPVEHAAQLSGHRNLLVYAAETIILSVGSVLGSYRQQSRHFPRKLHDVLLKYTMTIAYGASIGLHWLRTRVSVSVLLALCSVCDDTSMYLRHVL